MLNWDQDPKRTERGIQMLLRRRFPGLRSLDGAGGDGGRDAQHITPDGRTVFEIKSFGRLTSSRRRQVERSLRTAVISAPDMTRWVLVIPMNMTPTRPGVRSSEEAWFDDELPKCAPGVDLDWWGLDWLDDQVAGNMDIQRYIEGTDGQLLSRAREFEFEKAVLAGGAQDLRTRIENLRGKVDEISPFWTLDFSIRDGVQTTILRAKVPDAHLLDPIKFTPTLTFRRDHPGDEELRQRFEHTLAFGGTVDLPAGYVTDLEIEASDEARLLFSGGDPKDSGFSIISQREQLDRPIRCSYQVLGDDDSVLAEFHVYLRERTAGARGATLYGSDAAGVASFEVGVPRPTNVGADETVQPGSARLHLELPDSLVGYDICSLLPIVRTLAAAAEGTRLRFELPGLGHVSSGLLEAPKFVDVAPILQVIEDLHRMEQVTGSVLRFPANMTIGEVNELRDAVRQLDGETVEHDGGLALHLRPEAIGGFLEVLSSATEGGALGGFLAVNDNRQIKLGELTLHYGPAAFWAPHPRVTNVAELEALVGSPVPEEGVVEARLEPTDLPFRWVPRAQAEAYVESGEPATEPGA